MKRNSILIFSCFSIILLICSLFTGLAGGYIGSRLSDSRGNNIFSNDVQVINEDSAIIEVAEESSPSVVSIVITQDVPIYENYRFNPFSDRFLERRQIGTEEQQVGSGTGFIVSEDGLIITNRHVVDSEDASYTVFFSDGSRKIATVVARDTLLDIAFLDIEGEGYQPLPIGSSSELKVGQRVIAIGNALGEFSNTVSTGIISGLSRNIVAGNQDGSRAERLTDVIQTDASINLGNSGGPLLDIQGNVIGVNVAVAGNAENIGFAIPIDFVKEILDSVVSTGEIQRPYLGVRYVLISEEIQERNNLSVDYGALVSRGNTQADVAVIPGSPADIAGIIENDIILEVDGVRIDDENRLEDLIQSYKIGSTVQLKLLSKGSEKNISVLLDQSIN